VGVEEFLVASGLHPETHGIEGGHRGPPVAAKPPIMGRGPAGGKRREFSTVVDL
jgi:hypothetical protein